jgi:thioredoxin-dependent peroxiredoxin
MLQPGSSCPVFTVLNQDEISVSSDSIRGAWTVLYFYPRDATPGCTGQACSIRDSFAALGKLGVTVFGISPDTTKKHRTFREQQSLPFDLLSDPDHAMAEQFNVWVEKSMYGRKYMGIERSSFIIDPTGIVRGVYRKVNPLGHAGLLIDELQKLQSEIS